MPFKPASVARSPRLSPAAIREIDPNANPPEVRLEREILFVGASRAAELRVFAQQHKIPLVMRADVWSWILEPFLDTELEDGYAERLLQRLESHGIDRALCAKLRTKVERAMIEYNFGTMLWEWVHLGLFDLLLAKKSMYWEAMEIALRAGPIEPRTYTVEVIRKKRQERIEGFPMRWYAYEYARRRVRDSIEKLRRPRQSTDSLHQAWIKSGEDAVVLGGEKFVASDELEAFLKKPAADDERDWKHFEKYSGYIIPQPNS
jgi:hypothetical protein